MANVGAYSKDLMTFTEPAAADLSSYQYRFMKYSSGQVTYVSTQGADTIGILQNNPSAAGRAAVMAYGGISELELGGSVSQGNELCSDTVGRGIVATDPDEKVHCRALSDGSSGERIPVQIIHKGFASTLGVAGMALADGKVWIGDSGGEAAAKTPSGDATMTREGVITVADVTVGSDAEGDILYKNATPTAARLAIGTAGQLLAVNSGATAPEWVNAQTGYIPIDITAGRDIASNAIQNLAAHGGLLAADSTPILQRVNGATDKALRITWAAGDVNELQLPTVTWPPDLKASSDVLVKLLFAKDADANTVTCDVQAYEGVGDTEMGSATSTIAQALAEYTVTLANADITGHPGFLNLILVPSAHAGDALYLYGAWIEYTRVTGA